MSNNSKAPFVNMNKPPKKKMDFGTLGRVIKMLHGFYPALLPIAVVCIITCAMV